MDQGTGVTAAAQDTRMVRRTNDEWVIALHGGDGEERALADLRTYVLRAALFSLQRARHYVGHLGSTDLAQLAEDCAQESMTAILQRLDTFRGESHFTTWAYTFAVNTALMAARRERWASVPLDHILDGTETPSLAAGDHGAIDPEKQALQAEAVVAIREGIEQLTVKQQQLLRAVVFEQVPLDEVVRRWGSNRNALYKLLHDARRKLKRDLRARGFDVDEIFDLFAVRA
jgi:RNA polymerase sigma-70 factor (ECF subfamily)